MVQCSNMQKDIDNRGYVEHTYKSLYTMSKRSKREILTDYPSTKPLRDWMTVYPLKTNIGIFCFWYDYRNLNQSVYSCGYSYRSVFVYVVDFGVRFIFIYEWKHRNDLCRPFWRKYFPLSDAACKPPWHPFVSLL